MHKNNYIQEYMKMLNGANVTGSESHAFFTRKWNSFTMIAHERVPN